MYAKFQLEKIKGKFPCETCGYVGKSTAKIHNKMGLGRTADRAQRQGLEKTAVRHFVSYCAGKTDCFPHITGFIKKKLLLVSIYTTNGRRTTKKSGGIQRIKSDRKIQI
jgi:hypothetical protein